MLKILQKHINILTQKRKKEDITPQKQATRRGKGGKAPPSLIKGGMPLPEEGLPPCRGGGKKSTLFCNLAIREFLGKGVY